MQVYQTNAALGYNQLAFIVPIGKAKNGYNYLCIGTKNVTSGDYQVGGVVDDLEDIYLEATTYKVTDSPLAGTYLFEYWIKVYRLTNSNISL